MHANTCLVVDVWEGQMEIDEAVLKANGVAGMGIRLNDMNGGHHLDKNFWKQWAEAKNFVRFPYFVYNPWVDGAANYAWLAANCPAEALSVAVDVEVRMAGYPASKYAMELERFLGMCVGRWKVIIYTAEWFLPNLAWWPRLDYWWAQYPDPETYLGGVRTWDDLKKRMDRLDKPFNLGSVPGNLRMWQFSGDYLKLPGYSTLADVNVFYGNEQALAEYFGTGGVIQPPDKAGLYIFSGDNFYKRRGGGPLTLPMSRQRKPGDNIVRIKWKPVKELLLSLNRSNRGALDQIESSDWGPTKGRDGEYIKWIGLLWPGRNVVKVENVVEDLPGQGEPAPQGEPVPVPQGGGSVWGRVEGIPLDEAGGLNIYDHPHLVHMVYDYHRDNGYGERKKPVYVPILEGTWWVEMNKLVSVDAMLPKIVKIIAFPRLNLRAGPGTDQEVIGHKYYGEGVMVEQVKLGKGGIWGKLSDGWIALRHNGTNWTDWKI